MQFRSPSYCRGRSLRRALLQIIPESLRPWTWRPFLWLSLAMLWLLLAALGCLRRRSASRWWRPTGLTISALPSFSRAARFSRRRVSGRWPMLWAATLICSRARRRRSTESLSCGSLAATLWGNIAHVWTFTELSPWWFAMLGRRHCTTLAVNLERRRRAAWPPTCLASFKWRSRNTCWSCCCGIWRNAPGFASCAG